MGYFTVTVYSALLISVFFGVFALVEFLANVFKPLLAVMGGM